MFYFIPLAMAASLLFAETPIMWNVKPHQSTIKKDTATLLNEQES